MPQDQSIVQAKKLWDEKKPREAMNVLIERVNTLSAVPADPFISQAKRLWNEKKNKEAMMLLVHRINELTGVVNTAQKESSQDEDSAGISQQHRLRPSQFQSPSTGSSSRPSPQDHESQKSEFSTTGKGKNRSLLPLLLVVFGIALVSIGAILYSSGIFEKNQSTSSRDEKNNEVDAIDFQRVEKLINDYLDNESVLFKYGKEGIFSDYFIGWQGLKLGSHWAIGQFSINLLEKDRYTVSTHIGYSPICTEWLSPTGNCIRDLNEAMMNIYGFEMPNCRAEWIAILDTQEVLPQNDCARRF